MESKIVLYIGLLLALVTGFIVIYALSKNFNKYLKYKDSIDKTTRLYNYNGFVYHLDTMNKDLVTIISFNIVNSDILCNQIGKERFLELLKQITSILLNKLEYKIAAYDNDVFTFIIKTENTDIVNEFIDYLNNELNNISLFFGICVGLEREETYKKSLIALKFSNRRKTKSTKKYIVVTYNDEIASLQESFDRVFNDPSTINNEFSVYYQPKVNATTGEIVGAEALVRWIDSDGNIIMFPNNFIPEFEQNGLILNIDLFVLNEVCKLLENLSKRDNRKFSISLNFSRISICNENVLDHIKNILSNYSFDKKLLHIEITESAFVENDKIVSKTLDELKRFGIITEMDDFGSGYSSIGSLMNLKFDGVKLDRLFVENNLKLRTEKVFIENLIKMFKSSGFFVTVEGVETESVVRKIRNIESDIIIQGYYFFKPMEETKLITLLDDDMFIRDEIFKEKVLNTNVNYGDISNEVSSNVNSIDNISDEISYDTSYNDINPSNGYSIKESNNNINYDIEKLLKDSEERILNKLANNNQNNNSTNTYNNDFSRILLDKLLKDTEDRILERVNNEKNNKYQNNNEYDKDMVERLVRESEQRMLERIEQEREQLKNNEKTTEINDKIIEKIVKESEERIIGKIQDDIKNDSEEKVVEKIIYKEVPVVIENDIINNETDLEEDEDVNMDDLDNFDDFIDSVEEEEAKTLKLMDEYKAKYREEWEAEMKKKYGDMLKRHYERKFFIEKLLTNLDQEQKDNYNTLKNAIMKYSVLKNHTSKHFDVFVFKTKAVCKLGVVGKSIRLFLALDPNEYPIGQFPHKDVSNVKRHEKTPYLMKIYSKLSVKRALRLIDDLGTNLKLDINPDYKNKNYVAGFQLNKSKNDK